ncbi:MAG: tartrate dehydrogenase/decarboxylase / D-malate dehydrogenase [Chloroflexota bacterium]|nr:tartrate dehydrogenase/decarboxylase / D-malate dehydrogenase [Chloroflexota bacterium]
MIPGDGVGREVIPEGLRVLRRAGEVTGSFSIETVDFPWSCEYYTQTGRMMPEDGLAQLADSEAVYLGAVGYPGVPDHVSLWGLLLPIRQGFDQYVNLRPVQVLDGIPSPLRDKGPAEVDILCIRENTEGEYAGLGGRFHVGRPEESAVQTSMFTRRGVERIVRYAFERARERRRSLASATKSNALQYTAVMWDEIVAEVGRDYPDVTWTSYHADALAARMVTAPETLDVLVGSNLFGDILTDLGGALQGSLGLPASANLNPERVHPSMFEPVHGSAPGRAGQGTANPMAAIWAAALMLDHLGETEAATMVMDALRHVAKHGPRTKDLGGTARTAEVGQAIAAAVGLAPGA